MYVNFYLVFRKGIEPLFSDRKSDVLTVRRTEHNTCLLRFRLGIYKPFNIKLNLVIRL